MPPRNALDDSNGQRMWRRLRCTLMQGHDPLRHPLGGFRCSRCGKLGANLAQLGFEDEGYVTDAERRRIRRSGEGADRAT